MLKLIADLVLKTAENAGDTASFFGMYQPKEPRK